jgi:ribosomal protein S18 acetylase RimI-like enzyme
VSRVSVRPAEEADAGIVASMINAINGLGPGRPDVEMTGAIVRRDLLGPAPLATLLLGTLDGRTAGFVTGNLVYDAERAARTMFLLDLFVLPEARRHGVGRALVAALAARAREAGARCVWWGVDDGDDEALAFYRSLGARAEERYTGMLLVGDALVSLAGDAR